MADNYISNRKELNSFIIFAFIIVIAILSTMLSFFPFCELHQIFTGFEREENYRDSCESDMVHLYFVTRGYSERLPKYYHTLFLVKGKTYDDIPFHKEGEYNDIRKMNIRFNWDNSITVKNGKKERKIVVNKIEIETKIWELKYDSLGFLDLETPQNKDSFYVSATFFGDKDTLTICRQRKALIYGKQRIGFFLLSDEGTYMTGYMPTGKKSRFDY